MDKVKKELLEQKIDESKDNMFDTLKRLVSIRSVEDLNSGKVRQVPGEPGHTVALPYGEGVADSLDEALKIAGELGFSTFNMDYQCGWAQYGRGDEMIMVLGHLDVVPEADGWDDDTQPYDPVIKDGKMFGRGTIDDKGPVTAALFALKAIADCEIPLKRRVRIVFGCNEETGAADMKYYKAHGGEIPVMGFTPDGEYPLINGEKGIINEVYEREIHQTGDCILKKFEGGVAGNVAPDHAEAVIICPAPVVFDAAEKVTVSETPGPDGLKTVKVEAFGKSAHGSTPEKGENAIARLAAYLDRDFGFDRDARDVIHFINEKLGDVNGAGLGCPLEDPVSGKFTCNFGVAGGDENKVWVRLNYRYPVQHEAEECMPIIRTVFEENGWKNTYSLHKPKLYIPEDSRLVQSLLKVYREATGDMSAPKSIGGGTYAKAIPNVLAFGPIFPGDPIVEHLPNEFIELDRMVENTKIIANAIIELANA